MRWILPLVLVGCTQHHLPTERPADACAAGAWPRAEIAVRVPVGRGQRNALVLIPATAGPHDVVVNLHEFRSNPRTQLRYSGWADHVTDSGVIVVAPDARYATWNAGSCCGRSIEKHIDDVAFLDALMARIDAVTCTTGRVMATGIGNGAMMAEMWACESDVPDAVVSVGGSLQWPECRNRRPIPWLHYHGSDDAFIPMDARKVGLAAQEVIPHPVTHAETVWAARNRASPAAPVDDGALRCRTWTGAAPATSCVVEGGADTWPGAPDGPVASGHPLADATRGALGWVREAWGPAPVGAP
jgi:polyhydroxybutyrate depolymerase